MVRTAAARMVLAVAVIAGLVVAAAAIPVDTPAAGAEAWATSLSAGQRLALTDADQLRILPTAYRRALAKSMATPEERVRFWKNVFASFRADRVLTSPQREAVDGAEALLTSALFTPNADREALVSKLSEVRAKIEAVFGTAGADELFRAAAPADATGGNLAFAERLRYLWRTHRPQQLVAALNYLVPPVLALQCNCADQGDCFYSETCGQVVECDPYEPPICGLGCGDWDCYGCWARCYYPG